MALVELKDVGVSYRIMDRRSVSLKSTLVQKVGGRLRSSEGHTTIVQALKGLSLSLNDGDRLGIVGHNGAGKTTLLKVCAGILEPSEGELVLRGRTASMTAIALGMDPESTGYENIVRRGVFMGLSLKEANELIPEVEEFTELGEFLKLPTYTYSSGMYTRLAFAISTSVTPDILIMDEMIGTGDASFIEKARRRTQGLIAKSRILILASHNLQLLKETCNIGAWLKNGEMLYWGPIGEAIEAYAESQK